MELPVNPPVDPMLAKSVQQIPGAEAIEGGYAYEPKWDGFRCLVFRDGDEIELASRNTKPLTRYFPEMVEAVAEHFPERCVVDGEIIIVQDDRLRFEQLLERIHPAESRVKKLSHETPSSFVAFDLLALGNDSLMEDPFSDRREKLQACLAAATSPVHVTPLTTDTQEAQDWFGQFEGAGLDGIVAKALAGRYVPGGRAMLKIKHTRTADVVLTGYRLHKTSTTEKPLLGSMLLGIYNEAGVLQHVGVCASFTATRRAELVEQLGGLVIDETEHPWGAGAAGDGDRRPGGETRWNAGKDLSWVPLRPDVVLEVGYDHMEGTRFRHTTQFKRWRPDRDPASCTYGQLDEPVSYDLRHVLR